MGNNTTVFMLNDVMSDHDRCPERVWKEIKEQLNHRARRERNGDVTVMTNDHASHTVLIAVGGNHFTVVHQSAVKDQPHHNPEGQVALLRQWAKQLGYRVVKKHGR